MKYSWDENGGIKKHDDSHRWEDDYSWDRKWNDKNTVDDYYATGTWRGYSYYRPQTLSYSFIVQMASSIAATNAVKIKVGKEWAVDLDTKTLTYNPSTLLFSTKAEMLSVLLHEVGKIKLCTPMKQLESEWFTKYPQSAYDAMTVFDDFRVDEEMLKTYPSAPDIYESQAPTLIKVVEAYMAKAVIFRDIKRKVIEWSVNEINDLMRNHKKTYGDAYEKVFGKRPDGKAVDMKSFEKWVRDEFHVSKPNIFDYDAAVIHEGYNLKSLKAQLRPDMIDRYQETGYATKMVVQQPDTQSVVRVMENEVYPKIEDLLENTHAGTQEMKDALGSAAEKMAQMIKEKFDNEVREQAADGENVEGNSENGKMKSRMGGVKAGDQEVPKEWASGDYKALRESVRDEVKSLKQKLLKIRRQEQTVKFETNQKRGRLNTRSLYKHANGVRTLFKKKMEKIDTITSFAFSILVDNSGSMSESDKNVHTTRAVVMLSEVFNEMNMPFEIIHFDTSAFQTKKWDDTLNDKVKKEIAKYSSETGGGTSLEVAIKESTLLKRPERNKVLVMLTDGGVNVDEVKTELLKFKDCKVLPIGLECGREIEALDGGRRVEMAEQMPEAFFEMLTGVIKQAQNETPKV